MKKHKKSLINKTSINSNIINPNKNKPIADEETAKAIKTLSENGLHGKLATAQLHARTLKMEQEMSDLERENVAYIYNINLLKIFKYSIDGILGFLKFKRAFES